MVWFDETRQRQRTVGGEKQTEATAPLTMIASDMSSPRENYLLMRGEYDQRGEVVPTAAPASTALLGRLARKPSRTCSVAH